MSTLYATEVGFVIPTMGEELSARRRARKVIDLPGTRLAGRLYVLAQSHAGNTQPLQIMVNGRGLEPVRPEGVRYRWYEVHAPVDALRVGPNLFEFWSDADAMDAWALGIEYGHEPSASHISTDRGATWKRDRIGHLHVGAGEYLVRVRLEEGDDPPPPALVLGQPTDPGALELGRILPPQATEPGDTLTRVRSLATWTSTAWHYRNEKTAVHYAPWDPLTILAWGGAGTGHDNRTPIVMCVHYAITFVAACAAVGIAARPAAFQPDDVNSTNGHFAAEVWVAESQRWILVDPQLDAIFFEGGRPMSFEEVREAGSDLPRHVQWGPGYGFQTRSTTMRQWVRQVFLSGECFRHRAVWPRSDFVSHPERTPPWHGPTAYSELDFVWEAADVDRGFGMFRYFVGPDWFSAPPNAVSRGGE